MNKLFQEARDFAGADWENMKPESRQRLLAGYQVPLVFHRFPWRQLPPTVQQKLAKSLLKKRKVQ